MEYKVYRISKCECNTLQSRSYLGIFIGMSDADFLTGEGTVWFIRDDHTIGNTSSAQVELDGFIPSQGEAWETERLLREAVGHLNSHDPLREEIESHLNNVSALDSNT